MEFNDELEDLVVLFNMDRKKISSDEEYEILEDLITIEDEGIMDISHKLQQRDFDEYIRSLRKDTTILPESFCRIKQNLKLLDRCRPLTIPVVDCKKFKIFYNDKLAVNLKTRENFDDKFKEILSDKDNNISDDDTIEIDVDIADDAEMEDLIRIDSVQDHNHVDGFNLTQNINTGVENMNQIKSYDTEIYLHSNLKSDEVIGKYFSDDSMNKLNFKSKNNNSSNVLKVCGNVNCVSISTQCDSSICRPNKTIPHYHARKHKNMELFASKITNLQKAKHNNYCKTNQTKNVNLQSINIFGHNNSFCIDSQRIASQIDFVDYSKKFIRKENKINKKHDISKNSKKKKSKDRSLDKSMYSDQKVDKKINKHTKSIKLNIEMQKKIADMLITVKGLKSTYSKKSSKKSVNFSDDAVEYNNCNVCQNQMNSANVMPHYTARPQVIERHQNNLTPMSNTQINNSILSNSVHGINTNVHMQKHHNNSNINKAFMMSPLQFPSNNNLHCTFYNNNRFNFPDKNTEKGILSKSLSSINFMKPHLQKLAKANENPKSIKIRPIHNYGLSSNIKQQEIGKSCTFEKKLGNTIQDNTISVSKSNQDNDKVSLKKIIKNSSYKSNLNNSSVVVNKHPTIVKILQNQTIVEQEKTQDNNLPVAKINKDVDQKMVQDSKYDVPYLHNKKETQELQQRIFLLQNEIPQHIPTLQNCKIVESNQVFSKPDQGIMEYSNPKSTTQNVTEPWRIPLLQKTDKKLYEISAHSAKIKADTHKSSLNQDVKFNKDILKIIEKPKMPQIEDIQKEIKPTREVEQVKLTPSSIKLPEESQSPINALISRYQSPVQDVKVEINQSSLKIVRKTIKEVETKIEIKQKEVGHVKPTPSKKLPESNSSKLLEPDLLKSTVKDIKKSEKLNNLNLNRTSGALAKVTKKGYSPPVLPIPTFKKTFEILAKVNLISKYRYRKNRNNMFEYATVDQSKILLNRSITKDLEKYSKTLKGDS